MDYKAIALSILTALILVAAIFVIIKKTPKLSGRKRALFIAIAAVPTAFALFAIYIDATTFSLKLKANPKKGGTVLSPGAKRYKAGETAFLMADAADGYVFTGWSGASNLKINPLSITMDGGKVLTANFERFEPRTVQIGNRRWMAENLNVIPGVWCYDYGDDRSDCIPGKSWCYDNDESNCRKYGRLYDYAAAMGTCPAGWRLPTKDDWNSLIRAGGYNAGAKLKSKTGWDDWECQSYYGSSHTEETGCTPGNIYSGNGTDEFGFSALPGGEGYGNNFYGVGKMGQWWASAYYEWYQLSYYSNEFEAVRSIGGGGSDGYSIRCVQDIPGVPEKAVGSNGPPPSIVKSWKSGAMTVTYYTDGMLRVSGNGGMEDCSPPWVEYSRYPSLEDCNSPWRFYPVAALIIEDGVTHIGNHAFDGCHIMSSVTIPSSVESIGIEAFGYCTSLRSIIINNPNPPRIGYPAQIRIRNPESRKASDVFEEYHENIMEKACLYVPANSIGAYRSADVWKEFRCIKELASALEGN